MEALEQRYVLSTLFVDAEASGANDGSDWSAAFTSLQDALNEAGQRNGDTDQDNDVTEVWIADGTYRPTKESASGDTRSAAFPLLPGVSLFGGLAGGEQSLDERTRNSDGSWVHETILSGDLNTNDNFGDQNSYSDNAYTVVYASGLTEAVTLDGLTITAGRADNTSLQNLEHYCGGGIFTHSGTLTVTNSTLTDNLAVWGGGIFTHSGTLTVTNSTLEGNQSTFYGGGIYNSGPLKVTDSTFADNSADFGGGGIANYYGTLTVTNSTLEDNSADYGGGILNYGTVTVTNSTLTSNSADFSGGGICSEGGTETVTNSTLAGNQATDYGGGIYSSYALTVTNSTLTENQAAKFGGGIYSSGTLTVVNSTIVKNTAENAGGGVHTHDFEFSSTTLHNTIVAGNQSGAEVSRVADDIAGKNIETGSSYNLIGDAGSSGGLVNDENGEPVNGNILGVDNMDWLGPLGDNGGPTQTHALLAGSPAIDAGSDAVANDPDGDGNTDDALRTDQRGEPFARIVGDHVDIGAYEVQPLSLVVDTFEDESDENYSPGDLALREAIELANANPGADTISFAGSLTGLTITLVKGDLQITDALTITGLGAEQLTISGGDTSRIFQVNDDDAATHITVVIGGLSLTNGRAASSGGAIRNWENLTVEDCTISDNLTSVGGGGIYNAGTLTVVRSTISENRGDRGGGIFNQGTLTVSNSTILGNSTSLYSGGGIYNDSQGTLSIADSTISDNAATALGGGIFCRGTATIVNSAISGNSNTGVYSGGGIFSDGCALSITNSTISGNDTTDEGGGIANFGSGTLTVVNSTIANNTGTNGGGGVYTDGDATTTTLYNTIVVGNQSGTEGNRVANDISGKAVEADSSYNLIGEGGSSGLTDGANGNIVSVGDIDNWLGPLADNGGPTHTHALLTDSPAIDAGSDEAANNPDGDESTDDALTTDQRGETFARIFGRHVDIGAYENSTPVPAIEVQKRTNDEDADDETGPLIPLNDDVTWTYVVTNTGNVPLTDVQLTDDNGTPGVPGDDFHPVLPSGDTDNVGVLDLDETWTYTVTESAAAGQYANLATVKAKYEATEVTDSDSSHYFGAAPDIDIEKFTNDQDADNETGPWITVNDPVTWKFVVTNTGNVPLHDVSVIDDHNSVTPVLDTDTDQGNDSLLDVGEAWTYTATGTVAPGQYVNKATVTATDPTETQVSDEDSSHYLGRTPPTVSLTGTTMALREDVDTTNRLQVATIVIVDDGWGTNALGLSGPDSAMFEIDSDALYLKAGVTLDYETKTELNVVVEVDDDSVDGSPDDDANLSIDVTNVNEAPVLTLPSQQMTYVNAAHVFSNSNNNPILVADVDAGTEEVKVTLAATHGDVTLSRITGLTFEQNGGNGQNDVTMTFTGTLVDINAALDGMFFSPDIEYEGHATLTITVDDQGYSGADGPQQVTGQVEIAVIRTGTISGFVYADTNGNFRPDQHEGVPGVLMTLTGQCSGVPLETWTDQDGWYEFRDLYVGTCQVEQRQPECMIDGGDNVITVSVESGQNTAGQNFRELGLKPEYINITFFFSSNRPIGSDRWCHLMAQTVEKAERAAGHEPVSPPDAVQEIQLEGRELVVPGTVGKDQFEFIAADTPADQHVVKLNGESYPIAASEVDIIRFEGGLGSDQVKLVGSPSAAEAFSAQGKSATMLGNGYVVYVSSIEKTVTDGGFHDAVDDTAVIDDTFADDTLVAELETARMFAFFYEHELRGFEEVLARANSQLGDDKQQIQGILDYVLETEGTWTDL